MNLLNNRLMVILDPGNPTFLNDLAWSLASVPEDPWFDPKQGLAEARKAVEFRPADPRIWNTLGVAAFRCRDWKTAQDTFKKSISVAGGSAVDWFYLAMTQWSQGNRDEARESFDHALASLKTESKDDPDVLRGHSEAAALLGLPGPKPASKS
jgi:tetratricopeptide (TPR) repeat protein